MQSSIVWRINQINRWIPFIFHSMGTLSNLIISNQIEITNSVNHLHFKQLIETVHEPIIVNYVESEHSKWNRICKCKRNLACDEGADIKLVNFSLMKLKFLERTYNLKSNSWKKIASGASLFCIAFLSSYYSKHTVKYEYIWYSDVKQIS